MSQIKSRQLGVKSSRVSQELNPAMSLRSQIKSGQESRKVKSSQVKIQVRLEIRSNQDSGQVK